jgi:hypothetical protein
MEFKGGIRNRAIKGSEPLPSENSSDPFLLPAKPRFSAFPAAASPPPGTRKNEIGGAGLGSDERKYPAGKPLALDPEVA